jgi:hypothetical protein
MGIQVPEGRIVLRRRPTIEFRGTVTFDEFRELVRAVCFVDPDLDETIQHYDDDGSNHDAAAANMKTPENF